MKTGYLAIAAAIATGVSAGKHAAARRHGHEAFHQERHVNLTTASAAEPSCGCYTSYVTITGEGTLYFPPAPATVNATSAQPTTTSTTTIHTTSIYTSTAYPSPVVPTPLATTCPTPGVYTIPATTVTLTESTTVCGAASTSVPAGTHTAGGLTTTVTEATTVTAPYCSVSTSGSVVTSVILTTTYVCPAAGTYTIGPQTTTVETSTVWVYPTPASYAPGTYTQPEVVTTVTETDYVIFCPFTSEAPAATSAPAVVVEAVPTTTAAAVVVAATSSAAPVATSSSSSSSGSPSLGNSGNQWAMTYSPYTDTGACKAESDVASDIAVIAKAGFTTVRVYSTDCSSLEFIGPACAANGLKMILGVFINESGTSGAQAQVTAIASWAQWSLVELIIIGNEAVFSGYCSASELAAFITASKASFAASGYSGPCTTTEPLATWQVSTDELCGVVDIVGCNIHPFFNGAVDAGSAGSFVASQLAIVDSLCPGKTGINCETGWPSAGECNGSACPGASEQATAVASIKDAVGGKSVMFSFTNDLWKNPGAYGCEQSWGAVHLFQ